MHIIHGSALYMDKYGTGIHGTCLYTDHVSIDTLYTIYTELITRETLVSQVISLRQLLLKQRRRQR